MRKLLFFLVGFCLAAAATAQSNDSSLEVDLSQIDAAISQAGSNAELTDEQKSALLDSYHRSQGYIKSAQSSEARVKSYRHARENAVKQAKDLQAKLEVRMKKQGKDTVAAPPDASMKLADVEQQVQRDKAELAALVAKLSDISNQLQTEVERPIAARERLIELKSRQDELADQLKLAVPAGEASTEQTAQHWLLLTEAGAVRAEIAMLDEESLSQPMRLELLKAQQDSGSFERTQLEARINVFEFYAIELHKGAAEEAQSAAKSAEEEAVGKHPLIQKLAEENTALVGHVSEIASELESVKAQTGIATDQAQRFETDLRAVMQKLEIIGMSQALGHILREQQARLPDTRFSASEASKRGQQIAQSSLKQLEYEEERHQLRSAKDYVKNLTADLSEEEAEPIRTDLIELAKARRDLIDRAMEIESAYLRSLGDLDFARQRLQDAAEAYKEFIAQRLLWIRTTAPLSWNTFVDVPAELLELIDAQSWQEMLVQLGTGIFKQPLYLLLILGVFAFIRVRPVVRRGLRSTAEHVDHYSGDTFSSTLLALAYSLVLAFTWPFATWSVGFVIESLCGDIKLGHAIGTAFMRISYFYFGMEAFRQLLRPSGLVIGHFGWDAKMCRRLSVGLRSLERVFLPSVLLGIIPARLHAIEGGSILSMLCLIVALVAVARFFYQVPSFMQRRFDEIMNKRTVKRPPIWGRLVRWALILIPCGLIICMLLGYGNTAISFLVLLLYTNALIASLLVLQEMGARWFKLVRRRMVAAERAAEWAMQREKALEGGEENPDAEEVFEEDFGELETEALDDEARKLLAGILTLTALVGVAAIWGDVLPALGILDSVELWNRSETVDGELQTVPVTLAGIGFALVVILVGVVLVRRVPNVLEILLRQKLSVSHGSVYAATTLFRYTLIAIIVTVVAGSLGGSWSSIQWAVAALSVGIGFGLQEIVANFISGLILLFEQPIRVGDTVTVGETSGVVTKIRMRATTIRDWNRRELLVPNKEFITGRLLNWSLSDQLTRFEVVIGVAYGSDLKLAMDLAVEAGRSHPEVLDDPAPFVTFDDFGDNSLKLVLRCFMGSVDNRLTASSAVRLEVDKRFKEAGIVIAFPQRDVHLDTSAPLDITLRNAT